MSELGKEIKKLLDTLDELEKAVDKLRRQIGA